MFTAIKRALGVCTAGNLDHPYYLTRYFHCQVVVWLVQNQQRVWFNEHVSLESNYGFEETTPSFKGPLTYKGYCRALLNKKFWADEVVLYAVSCMWNLQIMSLSILVQTRNTEFAIVPSWIGLMWTSSSMGECITVLVVSSCLSLLSSSLYSISVK